MQAGSVTVPFANIIRLTFPNLASFREMMHGAHFCGALERHRLLWLYLERKTSLLRRGVNGTMLHVAPEPIVEQKLRRLMGKHYLTADLFSAGVDVKMDVTNIQYPDQYFDVIYCSHVLEHVSDDRRAMREFNRVLKKDGWAILLVPVTTDKTFEDPFIVDPKERLRLFGQEDHVRRYGPDYKERLEQAGFDVEQIRPFDFLSQSEIRKMAITDAAGDIYLCRHIGATEASAAGFGDALSVESQN
jgi:SAM-dependent methyltransferase